MLYNFGPWIDHQLLKLIRFIICHWLICTTVINKNNLHVYEHYYDTHQHDDEVTYNFELSVQQKQID